jgi:glycosyltransferase involved in cell wall biosynthesis
MRILISSSTFPIHPDDGQPRFVLDLAQELSLRFPTAVLAPGEAAALRRESWGAVDIRRFTYFLPRSRQRLAYGDGMRQNLRSWPAKVQVPGYLACLALATRRLLRSWQPHVVNSHWLVPHGLATAMARGRSSAAAHVVSIHAGDIYLLARYPFGRAIARFVAARSDAILADGSHVKEAFEQLLGRPSGALVQPMGVDLARFSASSRVTPAACTSADSIAFVGRLVEKKGVAYLVRAMPLILARRPRARLVVAGDGPLFEDLRDETRKLGIESSVAFVGRKSHDEVARLLRESGLAVVPSIVDRDGETEGMPTVVLEAMAAGARVVGTAVNGIPDVLRHGHNGWLCPPRDAPALASAILEALDDPGAASRIREALLTASAHSWPRVAKRYAEVFAKVAGLAPTES